MTKNYRSVAEMNLQIKELLNERPQKRVPSADVTSRRNHGRSNIQDILDGVPATANKHGFLDKFKKTLDSRRQLSLRKNATDRSQSQTSANSRPPSSRREYVQHQTADITSKHLEIEKRRFTEVQKNSDLHQSLLGFKYLPKTTDSHASKVTDILNSLERSRLLGYDYLSKSICISYFRSK